MARPKARRRLRPTSQRRSTAAPSPPYFPLTRLALVLPAIAFVVALAFQSLLKEVGLASDHPLRIFLTPLVAGVVVFGGLRRYPRGSRLRLAAMVTAGLFLFAFLT